VGAWRDVVASGGTSPTGINHAYRLLRKGGKEYEAQLTLEFEYAEPSRFHEREKIQQPMINRVNACLRHAGRALTGPGGETLSITAQSPGSHTDSPPRSLIRIQSGVERESSHEWSETTPCPVILHEVMHLMGLCDEYRERSTGYVLLRDPMTGKEARKRVEKNAQIPIFDCRSLGPADSLMADQTAAYTATFPVLARALHCPDAACTEKVRQEFRRSPGAGIQEVCRRAGCTYDPAPSSLWKKDWSLPDEIRDGPMETPHGLVWISGADAAPRRSLLYPGQLRALLEPGCLTNLNFYLCAAEAYRTSKANEPEGEGCWYTKRRKYCSGTGWVMGE
ncbi:MAG: hypothetical protein HUU37_03900, partial [Bdellovibrionales bacterium]|nr:hypothetical protein [Bdellovibrionales bacterium]